jgi:hypothetical protein
VDWGRRIEDLSLEGLLVNLAVGSQGKSIEEMVLGRVGVVWLALAHMLLDLLDMSRLRSHKGVNFLVDQEDGSVIHNGASVEGGRDTVKLDAEALELDLVILAPDDVNGAVLQPSTKIAGVVHHGLSVVDERVQQVLLGRLVGQLDITAGNTVTTGPHQARLSVSNWLEVVVQDVDVVVRRGHTDGKLLARSVQVHGIDNCRLSGTTAVVIVNVGAPEVCQSL